MTESTIPDPEVIDDRLLDRDQWIVWKHQCRSCWSSFEEKHDTCPVCSDGEVTKVPINPKTGNSSKSNDPSTWASFDTARHFAETDGDVQGLGFMFSDEDIFVGIDLDSCRDPETGQLEEWAIDIIQTVDSYTEISPSGYGLHTIAIGFKPDGRNRKRQTNEIESLKGLEKGPEVEMYDSGRFFTVTGETRDLFPTELRQANTSVKDVWEKYVHKSDGGDSGDEQSGDESDDDVNIPSDDRVLLNKARNAENGQKFKDLYDNGDWKKHAHDWDAPASADDARSEADFALATMLAFWTREDKYRMERLFNGSALAKRDKWKNRADYRDRTLTAAIEKNDAVYDPTHHHDDPDAEEIESTEAVATEGDDGRAWHDRFNNWLAAERSGHGDESGREPSVREKRERLATELDDDYHFKARATEGATADDTPLYRYDPDDGYYKKDGDLFIAERLERHANISIESADVESVADKIRRLNLYPTEEFNPALSDEGFINLENGILDRETRELYDHDPSYVFTRQIPVEYDPDAEADKILEFFRDITGTAKDAKTLLEWVGFGLKPEYSPQKFLLLTGGGRNGKGVYFEILREFYGGPTSKGGNTSAVELKTITGETRFGFSNLEGALMNIDGDVAGGSFSSDRLSKLKKMTGADHFKVEEKHQPSYEVKNRAKLAFAANEPPRFNERSGSIGERLLHIEFPYKYTPYDDDHKEAVPLPELKDRLLTDGQLSGLLNAALDALEDVEEKHQFEIELGTTAEERFERYHEDSDPIAAFASACLDEVNDDFVWVSKDALYSTFENFVMDEMGSKSPTAKNVFFRKLGQFADYDTGRPKIGDEQASVVKGLWFTDGAAEYIPPVTRSAIRTMYETHEKLDRKRANQLPTPTPQETTLDDTTAATDGGGPEAKTRKDELNAVEATLEEEYDGSPIPTGSLCQTIADRHEIRPERTEELLDKLVRQSRIAHVPGGKYEPL